MKQNLSKNQFMVISLTLFAMFFGAGNFIFPPNLGREAGQNFYVAIMFFCFYRCLALRRSLEQKAFKAWYAV